MKLNTLKKMYWWSNSIFSIMMFLDGIGGVTRQEAGQEVMRHLGFPVYAMVIFGIAKLLGAMAILQNKYIAIKEWAYAGFAINFLGAFCSRLTVGDSLFETIFPLIILALMFVPYFSWKKYMSEKYALN